MNILKRSITSKQKYKSQMLGPDEVSQDQILKTAMTLDS